MGRLRLAVVFVMALGCGADNRIEPRFVAVHNAMTALGFSQNGPISEGSLPQGETARVDVQLTVGQCYSILALGYEGVGNVDLRVLEASGEEIGRDATRDAQAVTQVCPARSGPHQILVTMGEGEGGYSVAMWSSAVSNTALVRTTTRPEGGVHGTCGDPIDLDIGQTIEGDTRQGAANLHGSCAAGPAAEQVYRVQIDQLTKLTATVQTTFDGAIYLQQECGGRQSEIACNDDSPNPTRSEIEVTLQPGTYYLVVDGYGEEVGEYELTVVSTPLQAVGDVCGDAQRLPKGRPVSGTTRGSANYFQATCSGGARSSDRVYRLEVPRRSRLRVRQQTDHDGALYIRRTCDDPSTEVACNDDFRDQHHSLITGVYDPGEYYVYTDGFSPNQTGSFTLTAEVAPEEGGEAAGETCEAPGVLMPGKSDRVDTFAAKDDTAGSCGGTNAPDVVYRIHVASRSRLRVTAKESEFAGFMYLRKVCDNNASELVCTPVVAGREAAFDTEVTSGDYFLFVDGASREAFGSLRVDVRLDDLADLTRACKNAPLIHPGRVIASTTEGSADYFQAPCAGGARSPDKVYKLVLNKRSLVRLKAATEYDGALHVRRDCMDAATLLACSDDHGDSKHSAVEEVLDKGTYYVVVDGFRTGNQGAFTLDAEVLTPTKDKLPPTPLLTPGLPPKEAAPGSKGAEKRAP